MTSRRLCTIAWLVASACAGVSWACSSPHGLAAGQGVGLIRLTDETQYLDFGLPMNGLFDQTGPGAGDAQAIHAILDTAVADLVAKVGARGDGETRQLGFMFVVPPWIVDAAWPGKTARVLEQAFRVALERHVAVHLSIETHYFWGARPDLWNFFDPSAPGYDPANRANVEWSDWQGTPYRWRYLDWGVPQRLDAPHMCYGSARVRSEVTRLGAIVGAAVKAGIDALAAAGHPELFSGITVGSEPSLDNYTVIDAVLPSLGALMTKDAAPKLRLGYCAFSAMGYSAASPPARLADAAAEANRQFIALWARAIATAGVPATKLYTHVAASAEGTPVLEFTNAPIAVAFVDFARPGWTTYPWQQLTSDFGLLTAALAAHGNPHWGGTEAAPFDGTRAVPVYDYLRRHYDANATLVVMNTGAGGSLAGALSQAVYSPEALEAYRRFLSP